MYFACKMLIKILPLRNRVHSFVVSKKNQTRTILSSCQNKFAKRKLCKHRCFLHSKRTQPKTEERGKKVIGSKPPLCNSWQTQKCQCIWLCVCVVSAPVMFAFFQSAKKNMLEWFCGTALSDGEGGGWLGCDDDDNGWWRQGAGFTTSVMSRSSSSVGGRLSLVGRNLPLSQTWLLFFSILRGNFLSLSLAHQYLHIYAHGFAHCRCFIVVSSQLSAGKFFHSAASMRVLVFV